MTLDEIKRLIEFIRAQELNEFELEQDGVKIRIKSGAGPHPIPIVQALPVIAAPVVPGAPAAPAASASALASATGASADKPDLPEAADAGSELAIVKSPIVGTFYRASDPEAKSFVEVGDTVKKGEVLCIIEAMKLMNEIDSEYDGEIVNIYVENGQPVQYGERLFAIKTK